ncbi:MAG TPA: cytochrome ubiquinol oxidase subunit I [Terriglobales bacterium]|nr:cytochrome ubiquinol oxidase subunit I [Terriglobales bacterium]
MITVSILMNYPLWQIGFPGGLLIALVAVVHVFVSHFAVGGGAYLVLLESRARRLNNAGLLAYVRRHSVFFALLTLVFGAVTGVGIWFTIGLVSPEATSSLIHTFVWGWAIEWVFFFVEITAALIYAYGWDRLDSATHMAVGWVYFAAAWASLAIINGIITYMLTPGTGSRPTPSGTASSIRPTGRRWCCGRACRSRWRACLD